MDQTHTTDRPLSISHRNNCSRKIRNGAPAYSHFDGFGAQDSRPNGVGHEILPFLPPTQVSVAGISNDEEPMEVSSNKWFIFKLFDMLEDKSVNTYIHWNETGDSIVIPDIEGFKRNALRKYFDIPFESFHRQLNGYSFKKTQRSTTTGTWKHKENKFRRGCRSLLHEIKRSDAHPGKTMQQDQPPREVANDFGGFPLSHPDRPLDPWSKVSDLEQENDSLKIEVYEMKEALADLEGRQSRTEAALEELRRKFEAFSFPPAPTLGASGHIHEAPLPTPFNIPAMPHAIYSGTAAQFGLIDMLQPMVANRSHVTGTGTQSTIGVSRLPGNALFQHPHYTTPTAVLPPQHLVSEVDPSPPSSAVRLPAHQEHSYLLSSVAITEQHWQSSSPILCQQMHLDSGDFSAVPFQNSPAGPTRPSRGSPRPLNLPTVIVQRRQPKDAIPDPGAHPQSSYPSPGWSGLRWG